jgi:hypothetical protein
MPAVQSARHIEVIGNEAAMSGALAWYRARGIHHKPVGPTTVPTLYIWAMPTTRWAAPLPKAPPPA